MGVDVLLKYQYWCRDMLVAAVAAGDVVSVNQIHGAEVASAVGESLGMQYQTKMHGSFQGESLLSVTTEPSGTTALHHHPIHNSQHPLVNRHY